MVFIEKRFCSKHGTTPHINDECSECGEERMKILKLVKDNEREHFLRLTVDQKLLYLFNKVSDT
jgi:hypothetical protein